MFASQWKANMTLLYPEIFFVIQCVLRQTKQTSSRSRVLDASEKLQASELMDKRDLHGIHDFKHFHRDLWILCVVLVVRKTLWYYRVNPCQSFWGGEGELVATLPSRNYWYHTFTLSPSKSWSCFHVYFSGCVSTCFHVYFDGRVSRLLYTPLSLSFSHKRVCQFSFSCFRMHPFLAIWLGQWQTYLLLDDDTAIYCFHSQPNENL